MAEFFRNNPIALRNCLLYVFLQKKSIETSFDDFCETVGPDIIKKEEFRFWFLQFRKGIIYLDEQPVADLKEFIRNDKRALRVCILYESLRGNRLPVFPKYIQFCKVIGDDVMEYREFELWYFRFLNKEYDLNYERDKDKKIYELIDMPIDIMKNIAQYLNIVDRVSLTKTSHPFKTFVEDQKSFCKTLTFEIGVNSACISSGKNRKIFIEKNGDDCSRKSRFPRTQKLIKGVSYWKKGIQELESVLKYPKLHLEDFFFEFFWATETTSENRLKAVNETSDTFEAVFKSIQQLHVKKLTILAHSIKPLLMILPSFKPEYLDSMKICIREPEADLTEKLVELEQWKQAKFLDMSYNLYFGQLCHLYHFKKFHVILNKLSVEDVYQMKEILFKSPDFEKCTIKMLISRNSFDMDTIKREFGIQGREDTYHYPIPNSMEYFKIETCYLFNHWLIIITKKNE